MESFELHRRLDGRIERFDRVEPHAFRSLGDPASKSGLEIRRDAVTGWAAFDRRTGVLTGRPWSPLPDHGDQPPLGDWVRRIGDMSYLYTLEPDCA